MAATRLEATNASTLPLVSSVSSSAILLLFSTAVLARSLTSPNIDWSLSVAVSVISGAVAIFINPFAKGEAIVNMAGLGTTVEATSSLSTIASTAAASGAGATGGSGGTAATSGAAGTGSEAAASVSGGRIWGGAAAGTASGEGASASTI